MGAGFEASPGQRQRKNVVSRTGIRGAWIQSSMDDVCFRSFVVHHHVIDFVSFRETAFDAGIDEFGSLKSVSQHK